MNALGINILRKFGNLAKLWSACHFCDTFSVPLGPKEGVSLGRTIQNIPYFYILYNLRFVLLEKFGASFLMDAHL